MNYIQPSFYEAAHLISQDFVDPQIKFDEKGRVQIHFTDIDLIKLELEEFNNNEHLIGYVDGIKKLRKMIKSERKKLKKANGAVKKSDTYTTTTN